MADVLDDLADAMGIEDAAKLLRYSLPSMWRLCLGGKVASIKVGGRRFFRRADLIAYVEACGEDKPTRKPGGGGRTRAERQAAAARASAECKALGC